MIAAVRLRDYFARLHANLVAAVQRIEDHDALHTDHWRKDGSESLVGAGCTCVVEQGQVFERGGIAFSQVNGQSLPAAASARRPELAGRSFEAIGVSVVLHPENPYCPTAHLNVRALFATRPAQEAVWWFGGGMDLTPYYPFEEDIRHFHATCKSALQPFGEDVYPRYKKWCDDYFFLPHRQEPRGVGGIFFDDLNEGGFERCFALARSVGDAFARAYLPIIDKRRTIPFGERERDFQAYRRGRYVEFNLVCDRGTLFGLQAGGRTESILVSLPPLVKWRYRWQPASGTPEAALYEVLAPRSWA